LAMPDLHEMRTVNAPEIRAIIEGPLSGCAKLGRRRFLALVRWIRRRDRPGVSAVRWDSPARSLLASRPSAARSVTRPERLSRGSARGKYGCNAEATVQQALRRSTRAGRTQMRNLER
jgi:hypothetical protein